MFSTRSNPSLQCSAPWGLGPCGLWPYALRCSAHCNLHSYSILHTWRRRCVLCLVCGTHATCLASLHVCRLDVSSLLHVCQRCMFVSANTFVNAACLSSKSCRHITTFTTCVCELMSATKNCNTPTQRQHLQLSKHKPYHHSMELSCKHTHATLCSADTAFLWRELLYFGGCCFPRLELLLFSRLPSSGLTRSVAAKESMHCSFLLLYRLRSFGDNCTFSCVCASDRHEMGEASLGDLRVKELP